MHKKTTHTGGVIVPVAGQRTGIRLVNAARNSYITLVFRARIVEAGAVATKIRNRGSVLALFDEVVLDENGRDATVIDPRVLGFLSEMAAPSNRTTVRVTSFANGTTDLVECVRLYFAHPLALDPLETTFVERDPRQVLNLAVTLSNNAATRLLDGGATISNVSVKVYQAYEEPSIAGARPLFIPYVRQQIDTITGAVTQFPSFLRTTNPIRAIVLSQETTTDGEVGDILNSFTLRGDFKTLIGPDFVASDYRLDSEFEAGGNMVSSNGAHLGLPFQRYGRLSEALNPGQDANLRLEFNAQPSVTGAGASQIRTTIIELVRDPAVTSDAVPFPY